jgi:fluoride exporter
MGKSTIGGGQRFGPPVDIFPPHPQGNRMFLVLLQVAIGGALGSALRFLATAWLGAPWATLAVNVLGSFVMGLLFVVLTNRLHLAPFLLSGVLGGFTTFSAFSLDALKLWQSGQPGPAALYVAGSVALSLLAVAAGATLAQRGLA